MRKRVWISICIGIVIFVLAITIGILLRNRQKEKENPEKIGAEFEIGSDEGGRIPSWEERSITEKYASVSYGEYQYNTMNTTISKEHIGNFLGMAEAEGWDYLDFVLDSTKKKVYTNKVELYDIQNLPLKYALAVKFSQDDNYYVYTNTMDYYPKTLGEFMDELKIKENVTFGTVYYLDSYINEEGKREFHHYEFKEVDKEKILQMLFSDSILVNEHADGVWHDELMGISTNLPLYGIKNLSVSVCEDGYLTTNMWKGYRTSLLYWKRKSGGICKLYTRKLPSIRKSTE